MRCARSRERLSIALSHLSVGRHAAQGRKWFVLMEIIILRGGGRRRDDVTGSVIWEKKSTRRMRKKRHEKKLVKWYMLTNHCVMAQCYQCATPALMTVSEAPTSITITQYVVYPLPLQIDSSKSLNHSIAQVMVFQQHGYYHHPWLFDVTMWGRCYH